MCARKQTQGNGGKRRGERDLWFATQKTKCPGPLSLSLCHIHPSVVASIENPNALGSTTSRINLQEHMDYCVQREVKHAETFCKYPVRVKHGNRADVDCVCMEKMSLWL